jgi:hypothetical protein
MESPIYFFPSYYIPDVIILGRRKTFPCSENIFIFLLFFQSFPFKDKCLSQLLIMLADNDFRVRNHVSTLIGNFIDNISTITASSSSRWSANIRSDDNHRYCCAINFDPANDVRDGATTTYNRSDSLKAFCHNRIVNELPPPLCHLICVPPTNGRRCITERNLSNLLYQLSNRLLVIENRHQQVSANMMFSSFQLFSK